ncbi:MAG: hypothetical protein CMB37_03610 [Euryarchaeota archaeon]|nr:hypothetical protein [Euryarchaeota archaeon]
MSADPERFEARIDALRKRGFDVDLPTGELASERMLLLEQQVEYAANVRAKVLDLPEHRQSERSRFLSLLSDPKQASSVDIELSGLLRKHRPWVIVAERSKIKWSDEGRSVELARILERLDSVDDEIVLASPRIVSMIEEVAPMREISPVIDEIERRGVQRSEALHGMVEMLEQRGWDTSSIFKGNTRQRFTEAERLRELDQLLGQCQRRVETEIRPFSAEIAERLLGALTVAQESVDEDNLVSVSLEISSNSADLENRLQVVEQRFSSWKVQGFQLAVDLPLLPSEMLRWEAQMPGIAKKIEDTHGIWMQMEIHLLQWPEFRKLAERTRGHLDAIGSLDVLLQGLVAKTESARESCKAKLDVWSSYGIDVEKWVSFVETEPRAVLEELDEHQNLMDVIMPLIEKLEELDTSIKGKMEVSKWLEDLRHSNAGFSTVQDAEEWLTIAMMRVHRHRDFLDRARGELASLWPNELDSGALDLAEYERAVSEIESKGELSASFGLERRSQIIDNRMGQVSDKLEEEFEQWRQVGWDVAGLYEMLVSDPVKLGLDLPSIRESMDVQKSRVRRLSGLPWGLNVRLAEKVLADLMRPEKLVLIDHDYQDIMLQLSEESDASDPNFVFNGFEPNQPKAIIEKRLPVLIPADKKEVVSPSAVTEGLSRNDSEAKVLAVAQSVVESISQKGGGGVNSVAKSNSPKKKITREKVTKVIKSEIGSKSVVVPQKDAIPISDSKRLSSLLGIEKNEDLEKMLRPPLDVRVQRLVRLAMLLERGDSAKHQLLWGKLETIAKKLEKWTGERLARRRESGGAGLLKDAVVLGERLQDIPGPGLMIPLNSDQYILPTHDDVEGLSNALTRLERSVMLPSALVKSEIAVEV